MKKWGSFATRLAATLLIVVLTACTSQVSSSKTFTVLPTQSYDQYKQMVVDGTTWTIPMGIDFVPVGHPLSEHEARLLKLHKETLKYRGFFYNELRSRHTFEAKYLEVGTEVWADETDRPRYLVSCGNQISIVPMGVTCPNTVSYPKTEGAGTFDLQEKLLAFLLALAALIAIGMMLFAAIVWLAGAIARLLSPTPPVQETTPTPEAPPTPAPVPVAPTSTPAQVPVAPATSQETPASTVTMRRFGPFKTTTTSDRQEDGFHVVGDGRELGVFTTPVTTEDAGERGHFVVHTTTTTS